MFRLVTTTDGGRLHVTQLRTGREVTVEPLPGSLSTCLGQLPTGINFLNRYYHCIQPELVPRSCQSQMRSLLYILPIRISKEVDDE